MDNTTILLLAVLVIVVVAVDIVLFKAWRKPDIFRVERRAVINAPAEAIFAEVNTIRAWETWSPWQKRDPNIKQVYSGPASGVGAAQAWEGNREVGTGRMTIIESVPNQKVALQLDFEKPFKANNIAELTLTPQRNGGTEVIWTMHGPATLFSKVLDTLMNMDKMCGRDFEAGLANLKALMEQR
jgi:uncharacterized protein YndB with AHSA1/START domain